MQTGSPVRGVWSHEGCWAAAALAFAAATVWLGRTLPQFNDSEAVQTLIEADAIAAGFHRWGLLEYTHHPLGRTYLLLPFVYAGLYTSCRYVPVVIAALCGGLTLWVLLRRAPTWLLRFAVLGMFAALLAQPGYVRWVGNLHQHSYNMSLLLLLVGLSVQLERARWLALAGFFCGCIGYDFFFAQVCTVLTLRLAFWNGRRGAGPFAQLLAAGGDTAAFLIGFFSATLLHYAQNVLYFSSATMAYHDLFGSLESRTGITRQSATRLQEVDRLARIYLGKFLAPDGKWSHPHRWRPPADCSCGRAARSRPPAARPRSPALDDPALERVHCGARAGGVSRHRVGLVLRGAVPRQPAPAPVPAHAADPVHRRRGEPRARAVAGAFRRRARYISERHVSGGPGGARRPSTGSASRRGAPPPSTHASTTHLDRHLRRRRCRVDVRAAANGHARRHSVDPHFDLGGPLKSGRAS
jgi:hypothetical protein